MMPLREDSVIYPVMIDLSACLCLELQASGGPELCFCGIQTGPLSLDFCGGGCEGEGCGGMAWVKLVDAFQSSTFPAVDSGLRNCFAPLAFTLQVGVARCAPMGEGSGVQGYVPPTVEQQVEAIRLQTADLAAMRRAIACCFAEGDRDYILGQYDQLQVAGGGCLGGTFNVQVWQEF